MDNKLTEKEVQILDDVRSAGYEEGWKEGWSEGQKAGRNLRYLEGFFVGLGIAGLLCSWYLLRILNII